MLRNRGGFTLIELLTVIAIIGILAAILIPVVGRMRDSARASQCVSNMRQMGVGIALYAEDHGGRGPMGRNSPPYPTSDLRVTFHYALWPYVGYDTDTFGPQDNQKPTSPTTNIFHCPETVMSGPKYLPMASQGNGYSYAINIMPPFVYYGHNFNRGAAVGMPLEGLENASRTVAVTEANYWYVTANWYVNRNGLMPHGEKANFLFYDGHVEGVPYAEIPDAAGAAAKVFWSGVGD